MTEQRSPSRTSGSEDYRTLQTCANCEGHGEIGTHQNYWGQWDTEQCRACDGMGEVERPSQPDIRRCECGATIGFCLCAVRRREAEETR